MPEDRSETASFDYQVASVHSPYARELGHLPPQHLNPFPWFAARRQYCDGRNSNTCHSNGISSSGGPVQSVQPTPRSTIGSGGGGASSDACKTYRTALRTFNAMETMAPPPLSSSPPCNANNLMHGCCEYRYTGSGWSTTRWRRAYPPSFASKIRDPQPQWRATRCEEIRHSSVGDGRPSSLNDAEDCRVSNASSSADHGHTNTENFLPRIIKPRKRKKKDRKPNGVEVLPPSSSSLSASFSMTSSASSSLSSSSQLQKKTDELTASTAKGDAGRLFVSRSLLEELAAAAVLSVDQIEVDSRLGILTSMQNFDGKIMATPFMASDDEAISVLAAAMADGDEDSESEVAAAIFCNCRYCDPQGVVWDVKEKRYSANLMQPGVLSATSGVFGGAATYYIPDGPPPFEDRLVRDQLPPTTVDTRQKNLQVSSQIVTSLNGHRDIEIKFYSSSSEKT